MSTLNLHENLSSSWCLFYTKPFSSWSLTTEKQIIFVFVQILGFTVTYNHFPKKGEYLTLVSLSTKPPQVIFSLLIDKNINLILQFLNFNYILRKLVRVNKLEISSYVEYKITTLLMFLVAKLHYKSKCPSICPSVRQPRLGGNVIFSAPN